MAKTAKQIRLFKVTRELNLAQDTLVQHLEDNGFELGKVSINTKLTEEMYLSLLDAFAKERAEAERHKRWEESRRSESEGDAVAEAEAPVPVEEPEAPAETSEPVVFEPEEVAVVEVAEAAAAEVEETQPADKEAAAPVAEPEGVADASVVEPEVEAVVAEKPAPETVDTVVEVVEPPVAETTPEVETEDVETPVVAAEETAPVVDETETDSDVGVKEVAEPVSEKAIEEILEELADEDEEEEEEVAPGDMAVITADRYRLDGPKVLGKVDLSSLKEPAGQRKKRRRKTTRDQEDAPVDAKKLEASLFEDSTKRKRKKKKKGPSVSSEEVKKTITETQAKMQTRTRGDRKSARMRRRERRQEFEERRDAEVQEQAAQEKILRVLEFVSANELAALMDVQVTDIIRTCLELGMMVSINQRLDADTIALLADEFEYTVEFIQEIGAEDIVIEEDDEADLVPRAPVVTIMGHVDHGKTSLLDYIRRTNVASGEAGGITQHIGAYEVVTEEGKRITFLDTPGHEAFTAMRARGAQVTDLVILVVAADDSVMPQTIEAINHAKAAGVPIAVAINKIDKAGSNIDKVMAQLADYGVLVEQFGGSTQAVPVSAKTGEKVLDLLEKVVLEAELLELKANPNRNADGVVIESRLDKGRGVVATVLVQNGTLSIGDYFVAGAHSGRVRAMFDENDQRIETAGPSSPALVLGFNGPPEVGDQFVVMDDEREARDIAQRRQQIQREQAMRTRKHITLDEIGRRLALGDFRELNLVLKADVGGSVQALTDSLLKLSTGEVQVNVIHSGVGAITESDVLLASASDAVIIGFQVRPVMGVRKLAENEEIDIRLYSVIYDAIAEVRDALEGMLSPEVNERALGLVDVRETFKVPKIGTIAGCVVLEGKVNRNDRVRLIREGVVIYEGKIASLRRFKDNVTEVVSGYECGLGIEGYDDIKVGDQVEPYEIFKTKRVLQS